MQILVPYLADFRDLVCLLLAMGPQASHLSKPQFVCL